MRAKGHIPHRLKTASKTSTASDPERKSKSPRAASRGSGRAPSGQAWAKSSVARGRQAPGAARAKMVQAQEGATVTSRSAAKATAQDLGRGRSRDGTSSSASARAEEPPRSTGRAQLVRLAVHAAHAALVQGQHVPVAVLRHAHDR